MSSTEHFLQSARLRVVNPPDPPVGKAWLLFPCRVEDTEAKGGKNSPSSGKGLSWDLN